MWYFSSEFRLVNMNFVAQKLRNTFQEVGGSKFEITKD
jgi:hypothetical protein